MRIPDMIAGIARLALSRSSENAGNSQQESKLFLEREAKVRKALTEQFTRFEYIRNNDDSQMTNASKKAFHFIEEIVPYLAGTYEDHRDDQGHYLREALKNSGVLWMSNFDDIRFYTLQPNPGDSFDSVIDDDSALEMFKKRFWVAEREAKRMKKEARDADEYERIHNPNYHNVPDYMRGKRQE